MVARRATLKMHGRVAHLLIILPFPLGGVQLLLRVLRYLMLAITPDLGVSIVLKTSIAFGSPQSSTIGTFAHNASPTVTKVRSCC